MTARQAEADFSFEVLADIIGNEQFLASVKTESELLVAKLVDLKSKCPSIKAIRGLDLMLGVEFDIPVKPINQKCVAQWLLLVGAGEIVIGLLSPLAVSADEIRGNWHAGECFGRTTCFNAFAIVLPNMQSKIDCVY